MSEQHSLDRQQRHTRPSPEQTFAAISQSTPDLVGLSYLPTFLDVPVDSRGNLVLARAGLLSGPGSASVPVVDSMQDGRGQGVDRPSSIHLSRRASHDAVHSVGAPAYSGIYVDGSSFPVEDHRRLPTQSPADLRTYSHNRQQAPSPSRQPTHTTPAETYRLRPTTLPPIHEPRDDISAKRTITCIICTDSFTPYEAKACTTRPCRPCTSDYCGTCIRAMFVDACKDATRMPPRCCTMLQIHVALPFLSAHEAADYRRKFEEWSTQDRTYCPVPTCSAFISPRLIHAAISAPAAREAAVGLALSTWAKKCVATSAVQPVVNCPECLALVCVRCKQKAHGGSSCPTAADVDEGTAMLLTKWGYKRCPKCRHGVRRMYGCSHMQCVCGAHWCWHCTKPLNECEQETCRDTAHEGPHYDWSDAEEWEPDDERAAANLDRRPDTAPNMTSRRNGSSGRAGYHPTRPDSPRPAARRPTAGPPDRRVNLDAGPALYWERQNLDFGDEPDEYTQDHAWYCEHRFRSARIVVNSHDAMPVGLSHKVVMECNRCWIKCLPKLQVAGKQRHGKRHEGFGVEDDSSNGDGTREPDERLPLVDRDGDVAMRNGEDTTGERVYLTVKAATRSSTDLGRAWECKHCGTVVCGSCKVHARSGVARAA